MKRRVLLGSALVPGVAVAQGGGGPSPAPTAPAGAPTAVTLMLDWFVNPDHGPIMVAQEGGHFARAGLAVRVVAPADPNDPPRLVAARAADIGVYYQKNLHLAVNEGLPLVRIGTLVGTPLSTLTVLESSGIRTLGDLRGKSVGYSVAGFAEAYVGTMIERAGLTLRDVGLVNVNFGLSSALMSGQVDAIIGGFRNFELNQLAIEGRPGRAFYPEENGIPAFDELIYVAHRDRAADPVMRRFVDALESATGFLLNNPEAAWRMFVAGPRRELDNELNRRAWRDTLNRYAVSPGALDHNRYERFARFLRGRGLVRAVPGLETYAVEPVGAG